MIKKIKLTKKSEQALRKGQTAFFERDIDTSIRSFQPGEWVFVENYYGFINPIVLDNSSCLKIVGCTKKIDESITEEDFAWSIISENLKEAINYRALVYDRDDNFRLVYGEADQLPGLNVDIYDNMMIVQINVAGIDRFRDKIRDLLSSLYSKHKIVFLDNESYRKSECLPFFNEEKNFEKLDINDNGFHITIPKKYVQKTGYYFDHSENRKRFENLIKRFDINKENGLDLFSFVGSWGLHQLKAGVKTVRFVDQADIGDVILDNVSQNFEDADVRFLRLDLFKKLKEFESIEEKYSVITCDPPALCKSIKQKDKALSGYKKVYSTVFNLLEDKALLAVASCTHYVSLNELDKIIQELALQKNFSVRLVDIGLQGPDHPIKGLTDKSHYLKYLGYYLVKN